MIIRLGLASAALLLLPLSGCASGSVDASAEPEPEPPSPSPSPTKVECPGGAFGTDGGARVPVMRTGAPTPEEAVEEFLPSIGLANRPYLVDQVEGAAWVLRPDGTAIAKIELVVEEGWLADGYFRCD